MAADFNPYHVWLGIPPEDQPANNYRLLGIRLFEANGDVIDSAADRQMAHLRTFQGGKHGELTQRLLNEVAAARVCLLDPKKRAIYDRQLRAKLPTARAAAATTATPASSVPVAAALPQPVDQWDDLLGNTSAKPMHRPGGKSTGAATAKGSAAKRDANNRNISIGIAAAVVLIAAVGIGLFSLTGSSDGTLVFDWPATERVDTTVAVDGTSLAIPPSGPWEYHCPAGPHHVVAHRLAFKLDANVAVTAGQQQTVPADWKPKATLVLNWPLALRKGAELKIDGRTHAISQHEPLEVAIESGPHVIQITRPGLAPIIRTATIAPDERELIAITPPPTAAKLVLDWPADQRKDAELTIDGSRQTVPIESDDVPFALTVEPGSHVVHITRTGFEPFNQSIDLAAGANESLKPNWTPEKKAAPVAETPVAVETVQPAKKLPVPAAAEQDRIAKQLDDLYKTSRPVPKDPAKAQELYDVAAKAGASPAERYMLLMKGAEIAAAGGDLNLSLQGIDTLEAEYDIDSLEAKQKLLDKFVNAGKADQVDVAIPAAEQLMDQAVAADRYDVAIVLATSASHAATKSQIATRKEIEDRLSHRRHDIRLLEPIYAAAKNSQETLDKSPADPEANLAVGRWRALYKQDWAGGLPLLAKGSDEKLKSLAEAELKAPTDADQQVHLAEAWWDLAQKEAGLARESLRLHAGEIYQAALPNLASALKKAAIEKRLAEIADLKPIVPTAANRSTGLGKPAGAIKFPLNQWVDVLRLVDTTKNVVGGKWSRAGKEIDVAPSGEARIAMPVVVDGGYDLDVAFNRVQGSGEVRVSIPVGSHACNFEWGLGGDSGLDMIDGHRPNDAANPTKTTSHDIENGRAYRLLVKVRLRGADRASIDVFMDGKPYLPHWEGNPSVLTVHGYWTMPTPDHLGLGAWNSQVAFGFARLRMISGQASVDSTVAESAPLQLAPVSHISGNASAPATFPLGQWVDLLPLIDTTRDRVRGAWTRKGTELNSDPNSVLAFPVTIDGGYDLEAEFTRSVGTDAIAAIVPVGTHECAAVLSGWNGTSSGLMTLDGRDARDPNNPVVVQPGRIENGRRYRLLVSVRILAGDRASVDVLLDGKPYFPHWKGTPASLGNIEFWTLPQTKRIGLAGGAGSPITFHSVRLRMFSGQASVDSTVAESAPLQLAPASQVSGNAPAPAKFPVGQWVDVLPLIDTTRDRVKGTWTIKNKELSCDNPTNARIMFPITVDGGYDLDVQFTRVTGHEAVATMFPVGSRPSMIVLGGWTNGASGVMNVNGKEPASAENPISIRPAPVENGHRYRLLLRVRILASDRATIDVSLDGKQYLPYWEGDPVALTPSAEWSMPKAMGLGAYLSEVTFHSARLRMVSGHASIDSASAAD